MMWYYVINDYIYGFVENGSMAGNSNWYYSDDVITEPLEDDNGDPLYMLIDGHVIRRP